MHPRVAELYQYAEARRGELLAAVAEVPVSVRELRPEPECWSVAEVLEHLNRTERGIAKLIRQAVEQAKAEGLGREEERDPQLSCLDRFRLPTRDRRVASPEFVLPKGELTAAEALAALEQSREAFRAAVLEGDGMALGKVVRPHPLLGPLTLYQWILFVGQHEARHALQIRDIGRMLTPGSRSPA